MRRAAIIGSNNRPWGSENLQQSDCQFLKEDAGTCRLVCSTGLSKKMDGIWNRYNLKSTGRIYTFAILKCSEKFKVLDLP